MASAFRLASILAAAAALAATVACTHSKVKTLQRDVCNIDIDSIARRGSLRVVTDYNSVDYFVSKGVAVGYQYELVRRLADHLGLELEIRVSNDNERNVDMLLSGDVDIIATSLIADTVYERRMAFAEPYGRSRQVLVQRADNRVGNVSELSGDTVSVLSGSFYETTIENIIDTSGASIAVHGIEYYDVEQIIQLVAESEISYTLSLESVARACKWYYPNIDVSVPVSDEYDLAWGLRPNAPQLKQKVDSWLADFKKTPRFRQIFRKYNLDPREHHSDVQSTDASTYRDDYEEIIKRVATDKVYNWLLVSSVVYQESHFNPNARSWAGAAGLMQLMPETARRFGVTNVRDPEQNISAGVRFLLWLDSRLEPYVPNSNERLKFTLAAYNVGLGHIMDAMRLAEKFGKNAQQWDGNVETALLHKANPAYYSDPVVKHGYCRATETINYVRNIMARYRNYKKKIGL